MAWSANAHEKPWCAGNLKRDAAETSLLGLEARSVHVSGDGSSISAGGEASGSAAGRRVEDARRVTEGRTRPLEGLVRSTGDAAAAPPRPDSHDDDISVPDDLPPALDIPALQREAYARHGGDLARDEGHAAPAGQADDAERRSEHGAAQGGPPPSTQRRSRRATTTTSGLRVVSANVQRSRPNTVLLLEKHAEADIICIQEPCWTYVKQVVSTTSRDGDPYHNTAHHRAFITLGARPDSRVVVYINRKRLSHASPRIRLDCIDHPDVLCVTLCLDGRDLTFINAYNDSRSFEAVRAMLDRSEQLPPITFMTGDFNLRHPMWDRGERQFDAPGRRHQLRHASECNDLISLATEHMALVLGNDPNGPPTWYSNNLGVREGVLDLLWIDPMLKASADLRIKDLARNDSDHAVLEWRIDVAISASSEPQVQRGTKEGSAFVRECRARIFELGCRRPTCDAYESPEDVEDAADSIERAFREAWTSCARPSCPTKRSKSWWDKNCSACAARVRELRIQRKEKRKLRTTAQRRVRGADDDACPLAWIQDVHRITRDIHRLDAAIRRASKQLQGAARRARQKFFDTVMRKTHPSRIWDFVEWTKPRRNDVTTGIVGQDGRPADSQEALGRTFQEQFTPANARQVDMSLLDDMEQLPERKFAPMSPAELRDVLAATSNFSAPGPDHVSWFWLKRIVRDESGDDFENVKGSDRLDTESPILAFFDACIVHEVHPRFFKESHTVVIPKPGKPDYTKAKAYRPIVLLNCLGKLLEKIVARRMQFDAQKFGVMHPCQFGGTAQHSTTDAGIQLVHNIRQAWRRGMDSSALLLDVSQFFPSIHHGLLAGILRKQGFDSHLCAYFENYLVDRQTRFRFNGATLAPMDFSTGVGQGSSLSPVLTGLYLAPILHRVAATDQAIRLTVGDQVHTLRHPWTPAQVAATGHASIQFFVDDGLIHVAGKLGPNAEPQDQLKYNCVLLRAAFEQVHAQLTRAGLGIELDKLEVMHFTRRQRGGNNTAGWSDAHPLGPPLKVRMNGTSLLVRPAATMRYLGFYLDPKLTFTEHVRFYSTKACSTVTAMRMLGNSVRGLSPFDRRRLYISNVLPVITYGAQLWWNPQWKGVKRLLGPLQKAQSRAARWITGAFRTTPIGSLECAAGLFPIRQQIDKYMTKACLRVRTLHAGHPTHALLPAEWPTTRHNITAPFPLTGNARRDAATPATHIHTLATALCQEDFDYTNAECRPGNRVRDEFHDRIAYYLHAPTKKSDAFPAWMQDTFMPALTDAMDDQTARVLFTDGSRMTPADSPGEFTTGAGFSVHYYRAGARQSRSGSFGCGRVTAFDAEMFALARGLAEACRDAPDDVRTIHVYTDNKAALLRILNPAVGPSQMCAVMACRTVRQFLDRAPERSLALHWCPAHVGVAPNEAVDELAKAGTECAQPDFTSLAMAQQQLTERLYAEWRVRMTDKSYVGRHAILPAGGEKVRHTRLNWCLSAAGRNRKEMARLVRFCSNHFPCGEYRERFNIPGPTKCWHCKTATESRDHIMFHCPGWSRVYAVDNPTARARHDWEQWTHWTRTLPRDRVASTLDPQDREEALRMNEDEVRWFLRANPVVGTFAWAELVASAQTDEAHGKSAATSLAIARADAHTAERRSARIRWIKARQRRARRRRRPLEKTAELEQLFTQWYAWRTAKRLCEAFGCPERLPELLREFGYRGKYVEGGATNDELPPGSGGPADVALV